MRDQQTQARLVRPGVGDTGHGGVEQADGHRVERGSQFDGCRRVDAVEQDAMALHATHADDIDAFRQRLVEQSPQSRLGTGPGEGTGDVLVIEHGKGQGFRGEPGEQSQQGRRFGQSPRLERVQGQLPGVGVSGSRH